MQRLLIYFSENPWKVIFSLLLLCLLAATQLRHVQVQISADELLVQDDPERLYYEQISEQFGDEQIILLYLEDENLLASDKLEVLQKSLEGIESLSFIDRAESLFSVPYLRTIDGYLNKDPYLHSLPESKEQADELLLQASKNPFLKDVLLAEDGAAMAVAIVLKNDLSAVDDRIITESINSLIEPLHAMYSRVFAIGYQHVRTEVADKIKQEQGDLFPLAIVALLVALFLLLRQVVDILVPVATAGISILWTLGLMGLLGIPLNVVTSIIPILLIIVGSTEDIHLLSEFRRAQLHGKTTAQAIEQMAKKMGGIIVLTFVTTYIGFLSVGLSRIEVLWQFGVVAATGLLLNFIATVALIPAVLKITGKWQLDGKNGFFHTLEVSTTRSRNYFHWLKGNRWYIAAVIIVISIVSLTGAFAIQINHNAIDSLGDDSLVKQEFHTVNSEFAGLESMSIVLDSGIQDTFLKVRYLEQITDIQDFIEQQGIARSTTSFANYLALLNAAFEEQDEPVMPDADDIVHELMIFLNYEHVRAYVSDDFSTARILIRHNTSSSRELKVFVEQIQAYLDENLDPGLTAHITGDSVMTLRASRAMVKGQLQSILLLIVIIISIISMLFLDWKVGFIAALPNVFPVIVLFGVMGFTGVPLNIGTAMAAAIAIGIAVDDTMHFMLRYNLELRTRRNQLAAMYATLHNEALPVFATSLALIAGFSVFAFSDFEPIAQFGILSAIVMAAALIADFVITPLAISALRLVTLWDMLSLSVRKEVIEKSGLFQGMRPWEIRKFILASSMQSYRKGDYIFTRKSNSDAMYLVMRGKVRVRHLQQGSEEELYEDFHPGDFFGDVAMLADIPRRSEAIAAENCSLLVLTRDGIESTTNHHPGISAKLFSNIAVHMSKRFATVMNRIEHSMVSSHEDSTVQPTDPQAKQQKGSGL
ncbi:MAG: MMPL family transporter [Chromatiales bacterium]